MELHFFINETDPPGYQPKRPPFFFFYPSRPGEVGDLGYLRRSEPTWLGAFGTPIYMAPEQLMSGTRHAVPMFGAIASSRMNCYTDDAFLPARRKFIAGPDARITISDHRLADVLAKSLQRSEERAFKIAVIQMHLGSCLNSAT